MAGSAGSGNAQLTGAFDAAFDAGQGDVADLAAEGNDGPLAPSARGHGELSLEHVAETPLLIDQDTGYALREMELHQAGRVRTQRLDPKVGIERYILFGNVSGLIEKGSTVALAIDGVRLEPLIVQ